MSGQPALNSLAASSRLVVLDGGGLDGGRGGGGGDRRYNERDFDVFEIVSQTGDLITARSAYLFEVGEEMSVRLEQDGAMCDATARVRGHVGPAEDRLTELELSDRSAPRST